MEIIKQFATTAEAVAKPPEGGIVGVLGIDWMMLTFQIIAFLVLVWLLGKFVYPWLMKSVDERQDKIEASLKAAAEAQSTAADTEKRVAKVLSKARSEANDIIATARTESINVMNETEEKAKRNSERIVAAAQIQIKQEVSAAKDALHNEIVELVTMATEKVIGKAVSKNIDSALVVDAIKEIK